MIYKVTDIIIYPIKSMAGLSCTSAKAYEAGFEYDRRWMLVDENDNFLTQRTFPALALFIPSFDGEKMNISYRGDSIHFGLSDRTEEEIITKVWDDEVITRVVDHQVSDWFSRKLESKVKLVKIQSEIARIHHNSTKNIDINVSLADGYPYLLIGEESLINLNKKLDSEILMNRFRPNIVVSSVEPHEEDNWNEIEIGKANFLNMKPCGRCTMITIDQKTLTVDNEPLKVINGYRKSGNSVLFGTNMMCTLEGVVSIGDKLTIKTS